MEVVNKTHLGKALPRRNLDRVRLSVIHRFDNAEDAEGMAAFFMRFPQWTGGKPGYHFVIKRDGTVEQAVELGRLAYGARGYNSIGIQIACIGDFRHMGPPDEQLLALRELCADLGNWLGRPSIAGHTELPGAATDPYKICPGKHLDLDALRKTARETHTDMQKRDAEELLRKKGYTI